MSVDSTPIPSPSNGASRAAGASGIFRSPVFWLIAAVLLLGGGAAGYALHSSSTTTTTTTTTSSTTSTTSTTAALTGCALDLQTKTYVQVLSVTASTSGGATLSVHPVDLHCGGPDDRQYLPLLSTETVSLLPSASITILDQNNNYAPVAATLAQLQNYVISNPDGNIFSIQGTVLATSSLTAVFHP